MCMILHKSFVFLTSVYALEDDNSPVAAFGKAAVRVGSCLYMIWKKMKKWKCKIFGKKDATNHIT